MADLADMLFQSFKGAGPNGAPLYVKLRRSIEDAVERGIIRPGDALPSERDIAVGADISRVTVRKAVQHLVKSGILIQRHGSGTFVAPRVERVEQSLSLLTSFTEDMARRGMSVRSQWLDRGIYPASPDEMMILGLSSKELVSRVSRLRIANDTPLAIERASLSVAVLPDPSAVGSSLYAALDETGNRPVRAVQRISADQSRRGAMPQSARRCRPAAPASTSSASPISPPARSWSSRARSIAAMPMTSWPNCG